MTRHDTSTSIDRAWATDRLVETCILVSTPVPSDIEHDRWAANLWLAVMGSLFVAGGSLGRGPTG